MCGICGIINFDSKLVEESIIKKMMAKMKHRGPDDEGVFIEQNVGLGFVRLSILDLSPLGHQPMFDDSGRYVIIHNGEVFNYLELREELKKEGFLFKSNTDTEVILKSYIKWGEDCLHKFNGMWAFVIYDRNKKELFCSRDRYGIKPFYYYLDNEQFIFASEIPPILSLLKRKPIANEQAIYDYLVLNRTDHTENTFFSEVKKLQHGHFIKIKFFEQSAEKHRQFEIKQWYNLRKHIENTGGFKHAEEFRELFSSAVELRLRSDVPVGVCLSGGLDSSSIVSVLLKDYDKKDLYTFSAVYSKGDYGDETEYIQSFNQSLYNMFFTTPTAETLYNDLNKFIQAQAEPIPSTSPYAQFKVMELAKDYVVVTLDGQGADELLAGYHYFFGFYFKDLLKRLCLIRLINETGRYVINHKSFFGLKSFLYFLLPKTQRAKLRIYEKSYLVSEFSKEYYNKSVISAELYGSASLQDALLNHFEYKLEHLLKWEDRNSMWYSIEARVPFLDHRLVEKTLASKSDMIIRKGMTKYILREAMKEILPEKIRSRKDKIGFGTPQNKWFKDENFVKIINEILCSESLINRNIINVNKAKLLYNRYLNGEIDISNEVWKWINLELWFRKFVD